MESAQDAFITSTNWTERVGNVAALATIDKFVKNDVSKHLLYISNLVWQGWENLAKKHGLIINISGFPPMIHFAFKDNHFVNIAYFTQEMLEKGFLAGSIFYTMYAHQENEAVKYLNAVDEVFEKLVRLISKGKVEENLRGRPAQAGFGRIN
jgi:glutamate-1-semialdehyde aminotransferase